MGEGLAETSYRFKGGRNIKMQPEGTPLCDLYRDFSDQIIPVVNQHGLVVIGGESRLGKTEGFLQNTSARQNIDTGGLWTRIKRIDPDITILSVSLQEDLDSLKKRNWDANPNFIFFDEGMMLTQEDKDELRTFIFQIIKKGNSKVVLVGGGCESASSQISLMERALRNGGTTLQQEQKLFFPARILTISQSLEAMKYFYPNMFKEDDARACLAKFDQLDIPRLYPIASNCPPNPYSVNKETYQTWIGHIERVKQSKNLLNRLFGSRS